MARDYIPNARARSVKAEANRVRRKYKMNLTTKRRILPGEISHIEDTVIVLKLAGYNTTQIARTIGLSLKQVTDMLELPHVGERLVKIRSALPQAALDLLQSYMIEAIQAIVDVMRQTPDDKLILQAAGEILDRSGLSKASRQERHQITEERMTITDDGIVEKLREASPEVQEQAAQVIEELEKLLGDKGAKSD
jgi:hypothetical protein